MKRETAIETLNTFPEEFDLETLIERLVFIEKVEQGFKQLESGNTVSHNEVKELINRW